LWHVCGYGQGMKCRHAFGFFLIGLVMVVLPEVAPGLCLRNGFDGSSGRELWRRAMGVLQVAMGGGWIVWHAAGALVVAVETRPAFIAELWDESAEEASALAVRAEARVTTLEFAPERNWEERRAA